MIPSLPLLAVLLLVPLSGCLGGGTGDGGDDLDAPRAPGFPSEIRFEECQEHFALVPFPMDLLADRVPSGFTMVPFDPAGAAAAVIFIAYACEDVQGEGLDAGPVAEMSAAILVEPPAAYARPETDLHAVVLGGFTTRSDMAALSEAWGVPLEEGDVMLEATTAPGGLGRTGHVLGGNDGFTAHMYSAVAGPVTAGDAGIVRVFGVAEGEVTGILDIHWTEAPSTQEGTATVLEMPSGVPPVVPLQGIGIHYWGEGYGFHFVAADLPE